MTLAMREDGLDASGLPAGRERAPPVSAGAAAADPAFGRHRRIPAASTRVRLDGKFFRLGPDKFFVKGVTYGPFEPNADGDPFPSPEQAARDFDLIRQMQANCIRIYHVPPVWLLDLAETSGLKIFIDVAWPKNLHFINDGALARQAHDAVRHAARACGNHPAVFALSVVNEIPPDLVRFAGRHAVAEFVDALVATAKAEAPDCLVTFANFPTTEYLQPKDIDFLCFNVYLHDNAVFRNYLARLQNIAGEKPLMLGEYGIDTMREYSEPDQARILADHVRAVFDEGLVGTFIFSFTDDWFTHGFRIEDWAFGLVRRDRSPKPAYDAVKELFARAPQTADVVLPKASIIICSYNGGSTVEACLRSLRRLHYPDFEIVFVDDGSTDDTARIVRKFPDVRYIYQVNQGLSHARNVGLAAATGEFVAYTDSDCEADEHWLYYLGLTLVRDGHAGVGGPNLIPDEGSWVADCVGVSPGGPTHIMIDDRIAEHVPGCNMAFYRAIAKQANGFDGQFRKAGDDVDFIWRLQHLGYTVGFAPAAQVWHFRRNTVRAYLNQQRGYGEAEALLKFKHPDHFNTLGASHWRGRIYGGEQLGVRLGSDVIYHGVFGTGLFQTIYRRPASVTAMMMMSVEWALLACFVTVMGIGLDFPPFMWVAAGMFLTPVALAAIAAWQAELPRRSHWLARPLIAYLHWRQPISRGWARYSVRLRAKIMRHEARGFRRHRLPVDPADSRVLRFWNTWKDRMALLEQIKREVAAVGWRVRMDSGWANWDMEIYGSRYVKIRVTTSSEHHDGRGMLTRVRVEALMSTFCRVLLAGSAVMTLLLIAYAWPFSRPALLIPLVWWAMFAVNKYLVTGPVLGLVDVAAERAGFEPVHEKHHEQRRAAWWRRAPWHRRAVPAEQPAPATV